jgi:putative membrane protein
MTRRLWFIITWPSLVIVFLTAGAMLVIYPSYLEMPWMHVKLSLVFLLFLYHLSLHWLYRKLQKEKYPWSSMRLRFYNEVATVLLFAIVFTAVFKNVSSWMYGAGGIVALGVLLSLGIMFYKRLRKGK